jgi:hypothetical protein
MTLRKTAISARSAISSGHGRADEGKQEERRVRHVVEFGHIPFPQRLGEIAGRRGGQAEIHEAVIADERADQRPKAVHPVAERAHDDRSHEQGGAHDDDELDVAEDGPLQQPLGGAHARPRPMGQYCSKYCASA